MLRRPGESERREEVRDAHASALDRYLADAERRALNARTLANYRHDLFEFLAFLRENGVQWLASVDRPLLRRWLSNLRGRGLAAGSIARRAVEARAFLRFAVGSGNDPFVGLRLPRAERGRRPILTRSQVARLLSTPDETATGLRDRAVLAVLYAGGLRVAELSALDARQVDFADQTIQRWDSAGRPRPAFVGGQAWETLARYLAEARPVLTPSDERALFVSRRGDRISARAVEHLVGRHARAASLEASPNDLRAACAAHLREGGATAVAVRSLLGTTLSNKPQAPSG
ncbi:MAG: tyrosine-type recombinase/integrase [Chloroflexota bacterium]